MRAAVGAVVVLALLGLGAAVVSSLLTPGGAMSVVGGSESAGMGGAVEGGASGTSSASVEDAPVAPTSTAVVVHVLGSVARPGIVEVRAGDRVIDAIAAAGGATDVADVSRINLARALVDGEQLYVPAVGEELPAGPAGSAPGSGLASGGAAGHPASGGLVNLNTADAAALETLPGVGPALAARILAWRDENGPFRAVDELLAVAGIGEKTLAGFRDLVTV